METYFDLGPGASSVQFKLFQYTYVQEIVSIFERGNEKYEPFHIRKFVKSLQQASGAYKIGT